MRSSMELVDRAKVNARSSDELLPYKNLKVLFPRSSEEFVARAKALVEITRDKRLARARGASLERASESGIFQVIGFFQDWDSFWLSISRWFSPKTNLTFFRSEERSVGKECRL